MFCIAFVFIGAQVYLDLEAPKYMEKITDIIITQNFKTSEIWKQGGLMFLTVFGSLIAAIVTGFLSARVSATFSHRLRGKLYNQVSLFSTAEISKFSTPSLITRTTNDVNQVSGFLAMGVQTVIKSPMLAIWAIVIIAGKGLEWSLATAGACLVLVLMLAFLIVIVIPKFNKMQILTDNLNRITRENLTGLPVVRAYNAENYQQERFERANKEITSTQLFTSRGMSIIQPFMSFIMGGLTLSIYTVGAVLINKAGAPVDKQELFKSMMVFSSYSMQVIMAFMMIAMLFIFIPRASVSSKRINEVLDTNTSIVGGSVESGESGKSGEIVFKKVAFKYPNAVDYVLKDISFTAKKGETVAFIGSTGSGKSTLINLIPRFYDATEGEILFDGHNIKEYTLESLRAKIGYVAQKAFLFTGTIKSNVAFGEIETKQITDDQVTNAVRIAQGKDFVEKMEGKYEGQISRGGTNVSGGQKQRIAIARAVARNPEVYIFDDSFSALDYRTDRLLRTALKTELKGATCLIVAQRIGTIIDADKIIVLDEGKIVGEGKHKELLENCAVYKEIAMSQLSEKEMKK
jgi:ATP-binding cassette subfamily B protein